MKYSPVIVVVAFNRPRSIERLLFSLKNAKKISNAKLIISIDNKAPENYAVRDIANAFEWPFGEKEVIYHPQRLGLRAHVLECGDLTDIYGSIIMLEDDLFVSPYFYDYSLQALEFYAENPEIGGISLYNYPYVDMTQLPFSPIDDDSGVFFMQFPSSLGQIWTADQWKHFKGWYNQQPDISKISIHKKILNWPPTSWKKYFCAYLVSENKYFIYPRLSLTTNFNDPGTHEIIANDHRGQTRLRIFDAPYRFKKFEDSFCKYDSHYELSTETVKYFCKDLAEFSFEMDLYGLKDVQQVKTPYIITSRPAKSYLTGYLRALKPHDMNVLLNIPGNDLRLCRKDDIIAEKNKYKRVLSDWEYYYRNYLNSMDIKIYNRLKKYKLIRKWLYSY
jgi:hypothetical protein